MDMDDILDYLWMGGMFILAMLICVAMVVIDLIVIGISAWGVHWALTDLIGLEIDDVLYWTGVGLLILFCAFGKTTIKKEKSD